MEEFISLVQEDKRPTARSSSEMGLRGERLAADHLVRNGYRLVLANFSAPIGRDIRGVQVKGEIDLIALDDGVICFVEVKARSSDTFAAPLTAVDTHKQRIVTRSARVYRRIFGVWEMPYRFDVVTVLDTGHGEPVIELFKGFWNEAKFKKRAWHDEFR